MQNHQSPRRRGNRTPSTNAPEQSTGTMHETTSVTATTTNVVLMGDDAGVAQPPARIAAVVTANTVAAARATSTNQLQLPPHDKPSSKPYRVANTSSWYDRLLDDLLYQLEYYVSDKHLRQDKFLQDLLTSPTHYGQIPLHVLCNFPRIKEIYWQRQQQQRWQQSQPQLWPAMPPPRRPFPPAAPRGPPSRPHHHAQQQQPSHTMWWPAADPTVVLQAIGASTKMEATRDGKWITPTPCAWLAEQGSVPPPPPPTTTTETAQKATDATAPTSFSHATILLPSFVPSLPGGPYTWTYNAYYESSGCAWYGQYDNGGSYNHQDYYSSFHYYDGGHHYPTFQGYQQPATAAAYFNDVGATASSGAAAVTATPYFHPIPAMATKVQSHLSMTSPNTTLLSSPYPYALPSDASATLAATDAEESLSPVSPPTPTLRNAPNRPDMPGLSSTPMITDNGGAGREQIPHDSRHHKRGRGDKRRRRGMGRRRGGGIGGGGDNNSEQVRTSSPPIQLTEIDFPALG